MRVLGILPWAPLLGSLLLVLGACRPDPCSLEPAYGGDATDEVWTTLNDAANDADEGGDAATFEAPKDGAVLEDGEPPTFRWSSPLRIAALSPADARVFRKRGGGLDGLATALSALVLPRAHAHLPPVTSDAYLLNIAAPSSTCPVQAVTTELSATLDDAAWQMLRDIGGAFSARVVSAYLESGRITEGPFVSAPLSFSVESGE